VSDPAGRDELVQWLNDRGLSQAEVEKVLEHIRSYDRQTQVDSIMDSIAEGTFNLQAIVDQALKDDGSQSAS